jgi:hypothetical protein
MKALMAKIANVTQLISRGTIISRRIGGQPTDEAEHFFKFEMCGDWFDMRDLGAVLDHEESPCPAPHAIHCSSVAGSSARRRQVSARRDESISLAKFMKPCPAAAAPRVAPAKFLELATSPHALEHRIELRDVTGAADRNIVGRQRRP